MNTKDYHLVNNEFDKTISLAYTFFWIGFSVYSSCFVLMISGMAPDKIIYLQLLGAVIFLVSSVFLVKFKIQNGYLRLLFFLYMGWSLYIISRGIQFNKQYLLDNLVNASSGLFLYLTPLIILFPKSPVYLKELVRATVILAVIYSVCCVLFLPQLLVSDETNGNTVLEYFSKYLAIPAGFILLTIPYQKNDSQLLKILGNVFIFLILVATLFLALMNARRGLMFMLINILLFTYLIYNSYYKSQIFSKFFPLYLIFFVFAYISTISNNKNLGVFDRIFNRITDDSRSDVEEYFYLDMSKKDWIVGKGIDGQYYCPTGATDNGYRALIETDYLQIMLKGGFVSLGILLLIMIPAIFKGFFYSKNLLSKVAASWILLWSLALYPATVTTFSLNYLIVWISVGICYSKEIRHMPEYVVQQYFRYKIV